MVPLAYILLLLIITGSTLVSCQVNFSTGWGKRNIDKKTPSSQRYRCDRISRQAQQQIYEILKNEIQRRRDCIQQRQMSTKIDDKDNNDDGIDGFLLSNILKNIQPTNDL
ncbi:Uncharacterised protein g1596 [Pycnogonum litorale]